MKQLSVCGGIDFHIENSFGIEFKAPCGAFLSSSLGKIYPYVGV